MHSWSPESNSAGRALSKAATRLSSPGTIQVASMKTSNHDNLKTCLPCLPCHIGYTFKDSLVQVRHLPLLRSPSKQLLSSTVGLNLSLKIINTNMSPQHATQINRPVFFSISLPRFYKINISSYHFHPFIYFHKFHQVLHRWWLKSQTTTWDGAETQKVMGKTTPTSTGERQISAINRHQRHPRDDFTQLLPFET